MRQSNDRIADCYEPVRKLPCPAFSGLRFVATLFLFLENRAMYPEPHIPSAPAEHPVDGEFKLSDLSRRTRFALCGGALLCLLLVMLLSISVMTQENRPAGCVPTDGSAAGIVSSNRSGCVTEPRLRARPDSSPRR